MSKPNAPTLIGNPKPKAAAPAVPAKTAGPLKWYVVESPDKTIRMAGAAEFVIRMGKEIHSGDYDIALLRARGVKLKEIDPPSWWVEAQERGVQKHAELAAKGINLPEPTPFEPPAPLPS